MKLLLIIIYLLLVPRWYYKTPFVPPLTRRLPLAVLRGWFVCGTLFKQHRFITKLSSYHVLLNIKGIKSVYGGIWG